MNSDELQSQILLSQPDLTVFEAKGGFSVCGLYRITDEHGILDEFDLEIFIPDSFPLVWPTVKEKRGRIPLGESRHANLKDGALCFMTQEDYLLWRVQKQQNLRTFLDGPLCSYLISQIFFEQNNRWPFSDRPHGDDGRLDSYQDIFGLSKIVDLPACLAYLKKRKYKGHHFCTCGSHKKIRDCHPKILEAQKYFSEEFLDKAVIHLDGIQDLASKRVAGERAISQVIKKRRSD